MSFDYQSIDLPVKEVIPNIQKGLANSSTLIVKAPPGAGKSTLVPLALLNDTWLKGQKIIMLEPRRLAAKTIANRMADLLGENVGETVGYRIRFENRISDKTKLEVVTEGILTRMIHQDNGLEGVGLVVFDEFHERSIHADVAMALCREAQEVLRPDLRILVMSATLDMPELAKMLTAEVVESKGRQYPVEIKYTGDSDSFLLPELAARAIKNALTEQKGDVLVFLPGQGEIKKCEQILKQSLSGVMIHPLYGQLPPYQQMAAIMPNKEGKRKVVLATNIAETSLTIEGIKIVIDSGFERVAKFNPNSGLSRLETVQISKDSADQRAGRAGRLSEGTCYRMWTTATQSRLDEHGIPEIEQADLSSLVLDMAQWGISDPQQLTWLSPPPKGHVAKASDLLHELEALEEGRITQHGKQLHNLPTHPRIAQMLVKAQENNQLALATDIAAILEERDPLPKESGIDINLRIEALRRFRRDKIGGKQFSRIEKIANQYRQLFKIEANNNSIDDFETGLLLAYAYPERIACARPGNNGQFQMANGRLASAGHKDDLAHEPWLAIANVNDKSGMGKIFMASPIDPKDLVSLVKTKEVITWDTRLGGLIASKDLRIGSIILKSTPLAAPDESQLIKAITEAIKKEGKTLLNWDEDIEQWQNRILSLSQWDKSEQWPDVSVEKLLENNEVWLSPYLNKVKKPEDLKKINLKEVLQYSLDQKLQEKLNLLAPSKVEVPSGSMIKLNYQANASAPVLAVRLQECFGLTETPTVNNGKTSVLMHLLSPGFKIVQITSDLKSFWKTGYFDVRKDLRMKYKRHYWPENPLEVEAIKGSRKRNNN
ncbi:ATP-dependent helicase HrpB [Vicingus serpentipes]|uniref:ATP-dependent helicase HrpB n=1 Tax=Vicingus serpentipes TaxID=1926625 RepID=A0A5C6RU80_9FLAO|nr:ATP-dependent helicase HrpB [Vicingus serpentipes]TXB65858.1 ATP-dependent helicase HrpB [Vicingus serpentipes]